MFVRKPIFKDDRDCRNFLERLVVGQARAKGRTLGQRDVFKQVIFYTLMDRFQSME